MAAGPAAGLAVVDALAAERALRSYPHLPAVRGDLLAKLGRTEEARAEFERAAALTGNSRERALFLARAAGSGP
jgi:predicted RNA polymerase sigma factor